MPRSAGEQLERQGRNRALTNMSIFLTIFIVLIQSMRYNLMFKIIVALVSCCLLVSATIIITNPLQTDFPKNQLDYMFGNFGEIPYGKTLTYDLSIISISLCGNGSEIEHFTKPTYVVIKTSIQQTCSYTKRALNAQQRGAKGIIIATQGYDYAQGNVFQGDDGNGKKVHITALFISTSNFKKLSDLKDVEIIAKYPVPKEKVTTLSLFLSSSKRSSQLFLRQLQHEYIYLNDSIVIEPIYHTVSCQSCNVANCLFENYCCFDYEDYTYNVGQKILMEELRQYAIFKQQGLIKWMDYMNQFDEYCMGDWQNAQNCSKNLVGTMKLSAPRLGNPEDTIKTWKISEIKLGFDNFPEVAINNMIYRGNFDTDEIIDAVCESLTQPPSYCQTKNTTQEDQNPSSSHTTTLLVVMVVSLILVILLVTCAYRRFIKKELTNDMSSRVGELVATYANKVAKQQKRQREKLIEDNDEQL